MISHAFKPDPHGRDVCDAKTDEDGRTGFCGQRRDEHMDEVHALKIQLAMALRERDTAREDAAYFKASYARKLQDEKQLLESASATVEERDALRADVQRLRESFMGLRETYGLVLAFAREVLGVLERGEDNHVLKVPDRTMKLLRCKDPIPTADDVLAEARAAPAGSTTT